MYHIFSELLTSFTLTSFTLNIHAGKPSYILDKRLVAGYNFVTFLLSIIHFEKF
jgi:hypothetical protein